MMQKRVTGCPRTTGGKALCDQVGVRGYPTIKHGDPNNLEDYKGGRDYSALEKFAKGMKPVCSPAKMDLCEPEMKEKILELQKLSAADLDTQIKEKEAEIEKAPADTMSWMYRSFDKKEMANALKKCKAGKATGPDKLSYELLQALHPTALEHLRVIFNML